MLPELRDTVKPVGLLQATLNSCVAKLDISLNRNLGNITDNFEALSEQSLDIKAKFDEFCDCSEKLYTSLTECGSVTEANDVQKFKSVKASQCSDILNSISSYLDVIHSQRKTVSDYLHSSGSSSPDQEITFSVPQSRTCNSSLSVGPYNHSVGLSSVVNSVCSKQTIVGSHRLTGSSHFSGITGNSLSVPSSCHTFTYPYSVASHPNTNGSVSFNSISNPSFSPVTSTFQVSGSHPHFHQPPIFQNPGHNSFSATSSSAPHTFQTFVPNFVNSSVINNSSVHAAHPFSISQPSFSQPATSSHGTFQSFGGSHPYVLQPPVSSNYFTSNFSMPMGSNVIHDAASLHLIKQQLFQKSVNPFGGEPHRFNSWISGLRNRTIGLNLSAMDQLLVVEANTTNDPLKVVQRHVAIGGPDPNVTLQNTLRELHSEFGSSIKVADSLIKRLDAFEQVKSAHQIDKLKDLLDLAKHIAANIQSSEELIIFNVAHGAQKIWFKMPDDMQNRWRSLCDDYKIVHDRHPPLQTFIEFLGKKIREYSDPLFQKAPGKREFLKRDPRTALKTDQDFKPSAEIAPKPDASPLQEKFSCQCLIHPESRHTLDSCRKFLAFSLKEKFNLLMQHQRCFSCHGPHMKSKCTSDVKCSICGLKHLSSMHVDKNSKSNSYRQSSPPSSSLCTDVCGSKDTSKSCTKTVLVDIQMHGNSSKKLRCYAILDEQSSSTFADPKVAAYFDCNSPVTDYCLNTLTGFSTKTTGVLIHNLIVKGVSEKKQYELPPVLSNPSIPQSKNEIASPEIVRAHPQIRRYANKFLPFDDSAEVLLLIGTQLKIIAGKIAEMSRYES